MTFDLTIRQPEDTDGAKVHALIARCPSLDDNSIYCNLLQCTHFSATSAVAEMDGEIVAVLAAYLLPDSLNTLFVWQVAVDERLRGMGVATRLLFEVLGRINCHKVRYLQTTITEDNKASWALFESFAKSLKAKTRRKTLFDRNRHFDGKHDTEILLTVGPLQPWHVLPKTVSQAIPEKTS
jgi:L-2,4-diaminobutyric acid acetyltransferase